MSQIASGLNDVNENVNQSSSVAKEVTQDITLVHQATDEMNTGSHQVQSSAEELSNLSEKLKEMVDHFKLS